MKAKKLVESVQQDERKSGGDTRAEEDNNEKEWEENMEEGVGEDVK